MEFFSEREISLNDLVAIGSDGTPVNTGWRGGIIDRPCATLIHLPFPLIRISTEGNYSFY